MMQVNTLRHSSTLAILLGVMLISAAVADERPKGPPFPYPSNGDPKNQIRFKSPAEADARRKKLVDFIWSQGLPVTALPQVTAGIEFPGDHLAGIDRKLIARVDKLVATFMGLDSVSYLLHPVKAAKKNQPVIVHQGHVPRKESLNYGISDTVNRLLAEGHSVIVMQMPMCGWNADNTIDLPGEKTADLHYHGYSDAHNEMFAKVGPPVLADGGVFRFFFEPVVLNVNHLIKTMGPSPRVAMIGLSGGAWTTHMVSAIDPRIKLSIPVSGSWPLYVRNGGWGKGDFEQVYSPLYSEDIAPDGSGGGAATWMECYALSGYGKGRRQIMITILNEPSTLFGGKHADSFKGIVADTVSGQLKSGRWEHRYDTSQNEHIISQWVRDRVFMPALKAQECR